MKTKMKNERNTSVAEVLRIAGGDSRPPGKKTPPTKWTMERAFNNLSETNKESNDREELNLERGIRSVAFLLSYLSENGNAQVDGFIAEGLGRCLSFCAKESVRLLSFNRRWKQ